MQLVGAGAGVSDEEHQQWREKEAFIESSMPELLVGQLIGKTRVRPGYQGVV